MPRHARAQNTDKQSKAAQRARAGAKITHILPLDAQGRHTSPQYSSDWGCIEEGKLTKSCAAVLHVGDVSEHTGRAPPIKRARAADAPPRRFLSCPFEEKDEAKALGAKWDQAAKKWYIPDGLDAAPFAQWYDAPPDPAATGGEAKRQCQEAAAIVVD